MKISIESASRLDKGAWKARLSVQDTKVFGEALSRRGSWTVVALDREPDYSEGSHDLSFEPSSATLLNLGNSEQALIVCPFGAAVRPADPPSRVKVPDTPSARNEDRAFLQQLTESTREIGESFLTEVRRFIPGRLELSASGRFVETPDNFWTVKIQPRDRSLRVTVRGRLVDFRVPKSIELTKDRGEYYSSFKITSVDQVADAVEIILQADERRKRKGAA